MLDLQLTNDLAQTALELPPGWAIASWLVVWGSLFCVTYSLLLGHRPLTPEVTEIVVSTIHAVVSGGFGVYVLCTSAPQCLVDDQTLERVVMSSTAGFLAAHAAFQVVLKVKSDDNRTDWSLLFHHLFITFWFYIGLKHNVGVWFGTTLLVNELSTPFLNLFCYLRLTGRKHTPLFVYNGVLFTTSFFLFRILFIPLSLYQFVLENKMCMADYGNRLPLLALVGYVTILVLNGMWFKKLVAGAIATWKSSTLVQDATLVQSTGKVKAR